MNSDTENNTDEFDVEEEHTNDANTESPNISGSKVLMPAINSLWENRQQLAHQKQRDTVPLWLITFTDVMALMLTFFVLLYAMSVPSEDKWEVLSSSLSIHEEKFDAKAFNAGSQDVINIDKVSSKKALDLDYVEGLVRNQLGNEDFGKINIQNNDNRLFISMPSELLFESGSAEISSQGKQLIFALSGILARIKNRVEIVGHADPRPIASENNIYATNWALSLVRAVAVKNILKDVGYVRDVSMRGAGSARFDELPQDISEQERLALSRRVDLVVMNDRGYRNNMVDLP